MRGMLLAWVKNFIWNTERERDLNETLTLLTFFEDGSAVFRRRRRLQHDRAGRLVASIASGHFHTTDTAMT